MAESTSTTQTVTKTSSGTVKITVEEYNDLTARANKPQNVTYHQTVKTPKMQAQDNVTYGGLLMGSGTAIFIVGAIQFVIGRKQLKAL